MERGKLKIENGKLKMENRASSRAKALDEVKMGEQEPQPLSAVTWDYYRGLLRGDYL